MKRLVIICCVLEALTGLTLLVQPALLVRLLFASEISGAGLLVCRVGGVSLLSLAVACWPATDIRRAVTGMVLYNGVVGVYFAIIAIGGQFPGPLLWPATGAHIFLAGLLAAGWLRTK